MKFGTWNILSWYRPGASTKAIQELEKWDIDITAVPEIRWLRNGNIKIGKYVVFYSWNTENKHQFGAGFAIKEKFISNVINFEPVNERLCYLRLRGQFYNYFLISAHAPTEDRDEETKDTFYDNLEEIITKAPKYDIKIILGDFNVKLGKETILQPHVGNHSLHLITSGNGWRLANLAVHTNTHIKSPLYEHKRIHKET